MVIIRRFIGALALAVLTLTMLDTTALAEVPALGSNLDALGKASGYDTQLSQDKNPLAAVVSQGLLALFGVLGMIFLVIVVYAGFRWMTAGGNTEQIDEAKQLIRNATIGLAIVILSYTITYFIGSVLSTSVSN